MADLFQLKLPTGENGALILYDLVDQGARDLISALGDAVQWLGVTTTELTDGDTTNPIIINEESVTATTGGMAQYSGEEFVWNGSAWQSIGKNNFGSLAFKNNASGSYTPAGSVAITKGADTTDSVTPISGVGTLPSWSVSDGVATFNPGTLPTAGNAVTVVTARGTDTAAFTGTEDTVTVS